MAGQSGPGALIFLRVCMWWAETRLTYCSLKLSTASIMVPVICLRVSRCFGTRVGWHCRLVLRTVRATPRALQVSSDLQQSVQLLWGILHSHERHAVAVTMIVSMSRILQSSRSARLPFYYSITNADDDCVAHQYYL